MCQYATRITAVDAKGILLFVTGRRVAQASAPKSIRVPHPRFGRVGLGFYGFLVSARLPVLVLARLQRSSTNYSTMTKTFRALALMSKGMRR
jgi:hypothetical protein